MCGIVAYTGARDAQPLLIEALGRLEYRGYDSSGLALLNGGLQIRKKSGRISELAKLLRSEPVHGHTGISHTRWATHGAPTDANAHPHTDQSGKLALVHNGVIENYAKLRLRFEAKGHIFLSATDTEVLAHLIGAHYDASTLQSEARLVSAIRLALEEVSGTYGIAVVHADLPGLIVGARRGSPLILGIGQDENFLASDVQALALHTGRVVYLKDNDLVIVRPDSFDVSSLGEGTVSYEIKEISQAQQAADKGDFPHFMLKEIFEQPLAIENAFRGRLNRDEASAHLGGLNLLPRDLRETDRLMILACGTALHAAMVGKHMIESLAHLAVDCDHASEFRYRTAPITRDTLFFVVSQSGETADTLGALREAKRRGYRVLGICNNVASTIARETDGGVYMHAGPEIGVAATKSFTSQVTIFALLATLMGRLRFLSASQGIEIIDALEKLPSQVTAILTLNDSIAAIAAKYASCRSMLFLGRTIHYPVALEGALKMKEISYIHAEGYPSSELKHGVIALIDEATPSVVLAPKDGLYDKNMNSIAEIKARGGPVIAIATRDDDEIDAAVDDVIRVPRTLDFLQPILNVVPLQLLAYHTAVTLGRDVDKPRNLAKSVTVE
ncbi:MAG: glutamine--fructose-6-phosphate transaminase (isomerizing) [Candidatus Methylacidiphilales bacterium]